MRRSTLGPVDLNRSVDDSRQSFGAAAGDRHRKSFGGGVSRMPTATAPSTTKKAPTQSRTSMAPAPSFGPDSRRSSLFGSRPVLASASSAVLADPRPLTTKVWMNESVERLAKFLADMDYPQRVTGKMLLSPTGKDFTSILTFMLRFLDPAFSLSVGTGKMEDEVHAVFKALRYPFQISKTSLTAVGSQQSWPAVMGAVMWLLEVLEYDGMVRAVEARHESEPRAGEPAFFLNFVRVAYERFLAEDDDKIDEIKASVADAFGEQHAVIQKDVTSRRAENARLRAEVDALRNQSSKLPSLRESKAAMELEIDALKERIADTERYVADISAKQEEKRKELERELAQHTTSLNRLDMAVRGQELSKADVDSMSKKKASMRDQRTRVNAETRTVQQAAFELERQVKEAIEALRNRVSTYSSSAARLQVLPPGAKYSAGVDFSLHVDEGFLASVGPNGAVLSADILAALSADDDASASMGGGSSLAAGGGGMGANADTTAGLLGNHVKRVVKSGLREHMSLCAKATADASRKLRELEEELAGLVDSLKDARKRNELLARRLREREEAVEAHRSELSYGLAGSDQRVAKLESDIAAARNELLAAQAAARELSPEVLRGLAAQVEAHLATQTRQRAHTSSVVARVMNAVLVHKGGLDDKLKGMAGALAARKEAYECKPAVAVPGPGGAPASLANDVSALSMTMGGGLPPRASGMGGMPRMSLAPGAASRAYHGAGAAGVPATPSELLLAGAAGRAPRPSLSMTAERPGSLAELMASEATVRLAPGEVARMLQM